MDLFLFLFLLGVIFAAAFGPWLLEIDHLPRWPRFESRRVKDHRKCLASIARLERELGMESTEQLRETLFGTSDALKSAWTDENLTAQLYTDEPGQVIQTESKLQDAEWRKRYMASLMAAQPNESSDRLEVF